MTETRSLAFNEYRTDGNKLIGLASPYNSPTSIFEKGRRFTEVVRPGAFRSALESGGDVLVTFNHDMSQLLGRTSSGTARLFDTDKGLGFEVDLPDTELGRTVKALVNRGDIKGASMSFRVKPNGEKWTADTRELTDLYLEELGPVTMPAYRDTQVAMRSSVTNYKLQVECAEKLYESTRYQK